MTHSRREELKKIIEDCLGKDHGFLPDGFGDGYKCECDECLNRLKLLLALEDKVILKSELLSEGEIDKILMDYKGADTDEIARAIHDRQEGR